MAVLKVGESAAGAAAAMAHTGAVAGDQRVFRALVEEAGAAWAEEVHDLLEIAKAMASPQPSTTLKGSDPSGLAILTIVPLPASPERVEEAILGLRAAPMFGGGRGVTALDVPAVARLAVAAGELLLDQGLELLELNPVLVHEQGAVAVDAVAARCAPS